MTFKPHIQFHNMAGSEALEADIRTHVTRLSRFYDHIDGCEVTVEAPHHHQHKGRHYRVMIKLLVPGEALIVNQSRDRERRFEDCYAAIHDAFRSARRRLQDYARVRRGEVKRHSQPPAPAAAQPGESSDLAGD